MNRWQALELVAGILGQSTLSTKNLSLLDSKHIDWHRVAEVASHHLVTPWLYLRIKQRAISKQIPPDFLDYLEGIYQLNSSRNREKGELLIYLVRLLQREGIDSVVMKGGASQVENLYGDQGIRMFSDLDLLISKEKLPQAAQLLFDDGFTYWVKYSGAHFFDSTINHHYPCLVHPNRVPCRVELHVEPLKVAFKSLLHHGDVLSRSNTLCWQETKVSTPCIEHRLLHNFVHNQLSDREYASGRISLRQMGEFGMLMQQDGALEAASSIYKNLPDQFQPAWRSYSDTYKYLFESQPIPPDSPANAFIRQAKRSILFPHLRSARVIAATLALNLKNLFGHPRKNFAKLYNQNWYADRWAGIRAQWDDKR